MTLSYILKSIYPDKVLQETNLIYKKKNQVGFPPFFFIFLLWFFERLDSSTPRPTCGSLNAWIPQPPDPPVAL